MNFSEKWAMTGPPKKPRCAEVYVLIADAYSLVDFVRFMNVQGLLEGGEYVVIALEKEETYNPDKEYQFIRRGKDLYLKSS
ncbi:guanylate cyclase [Trichonephila clavipes]|nr:guanylate cyclase [Trichonephila clavipes]